jgi:hypothetical protein
MPPSPSDAKQHKDGDMVAVLVADCDPPTMNVFRAVEALFNRSGIDCVWLCPLPSSSPDHARNMASLLCMDFSAAGKQVSLCSAALDKNMDPAMLAKWCRERFPALRFRLASVQPLAVQDRERTLFLVFGSGAAPHGADGVSLGKFVAAPDDVKERIARGEDRSRDFVPAVWGYVQKNRLYRNKK